MRLKTDEKTAIVMSLNGDRTKSTKAEPCIGMCSITYYYHPIYTSDVRCKPPKNSYLDYVANATVSVFMDATQHGTFYSIQNIPF